MLLSFIIFYVQFLQDHCLCFISFLPVFPRITQDNQEFTILKFCSFPGIPLSCLNTLTRHWWCSSRRSPLRPRTWRGWSRVERTRSLFNNWIRHSRQPKHSPSPPSTERWGLVFVVGNPGGLKFESSECWNAAIKVSGCVSNVEVLHTFTFFKFDSLTKFFTIPKKSNQFEIFLYMFIKGLVGLIHLLI